MGQKVYPPGASIHAGPAPGQPIPTGMMPFNPQAMVAQQNANMEMLERRRERERQREAATTVSLKFERLIDFFLIITPSILAPTDRRRRFSR